MQRVVLLLRIAVEKKNIRFMKNRSRYVLQCNRQRKPGGSLHFDAEKLHTSNDCKNKQSKLKE